MTVTIEEAQSRLPELIAGLRPGEDLLITQNSQPVARLLTARNESPLTKPRVPGSAIGKLVIVEDDEEHLKDFSEYMG